MAKIGFVRMAFLIAAICCSADNAFADGELKNVGQCVRTRILSILPRLQNFDDGGHFITYANGVMGFSYDMEPALINSKSGDHVKLCLTSIPYGCPKHDARGKTYKAYNLRTHGVWELMDSQHMCGGA